MLAKDLQSIFPGKPKTFSHINAPYKHKINEKFIGKITTFINNYLDQFREFGIIKEPNVIVGLSGGIDSSVACALAYRAVGDRVIGVTIDLGEKSSHEEIYLARKLTKHLGIRHEIIKVDKIWQEQRNLIPVKNTFAGVHIRSRVILHTLFQYSDNDIGIMVDTTDKSERLLGRHAEDFYGHFAPLVDIYKSELYDFAKYLKLPKELLKTEPGCPELLDIDAFGVPWSEIDPILYLIFEKKVNPKEISSKYSIDYKWLLKLAAENRLRSKLTETRRLFFK